MLSDCHTHTKFSFDSETEPLAMLQRAAQLGITHYCTTEHVDYDECYPKYAPANIPAYRAHLLPLVDRVPGLSLHIGVEIALKDAACAARTWEEIGGYDWDCIIGSVHNTDTGDPYEPSYFMGRTHQEVYRDYIEAVATRMQACDYFHVLGHLDYGAKYGPFREPLTYAAAPDAFDTIFRTLTHTGRTLELNTSPQRDPSRPLWGLDYLKRYVELGGEAVSFGSDAHRPEQLGYRMEEAYALARAAGLRYQAVYIRGERQLFPLA